ncbi:MAG: 50S ribosomal protein L29 [Prevotellaceae bacterium]|jgi:large subunit ribosomal protein L29|nr:50S ribosomal protein L29 [Prevotellaceae bacterium]
MTKAEIKELNTKDLKERVQEEKGAYVRMKLDHAISPLENTSKFKEARKEIARMLTELRVREINEQK